MPWVGFNLWKLELRVTGVHAVDLVPSRSTQHFNYLDKLVDSRLSWEERLANEKLSNDATY